jgi:hypothetical protein
MSRESEQDMAPTGDAGQEGGRRDAGQEGGRIVTCCAVRSLLLASLS